MELADHRIVTHGNTPDVAGYGDAMSAPQTFGTVAEIVARSMRQFPNTFPSPSRVLHHVLCVESGGFMWEDGRIIPIFEDQEFDDLEIPDDELGAWQTLYGPDSIRLETVYPMSVDANKLTGFPENVTDDWLAAVEATANAVLACDQSNYLYPGDLVQPMSFEDIDARDAQWYRPEVLERFRAVGLKVPERQDEATRRRQYAERLAERDVRIRADRKATETNHSIARESLQRVAALRSARQR